MRLSIRNATWLGCCLIVIMLGFACGGGGIDDLATGGGTGGTGISVGPVSGFGSIEVNGRHFNTDNAEIFVEGRSRGVGNQVLMDAIALGMIVRVDGDIETSQNDIAHQVHFNDDIRGPVDSIREIDALTTELVVLGQEILITDITHSIDIDAAPPALGEWVTVSGFKDAAGRLMASYIAVSTSAAGANIKGTVTQLNATDSNFEINGMRIGYRDASLVGLTSLSEGLQVEVTGMLSEDQGIITAERIELVDRFGVTDIDRIELTGVVLEATDTQLVLDSASVNLNAQTEYVDGELEDLGSGVRVKIQGELTGGVVNAEKVTLLDNAKVESDVASNQDGLSPLSLTLTAFPDLTIEYNEITKVTGAVDTAQNITGDHHVKIIGRQTSKQTMLAVHIIVKSGLDNKVKLQGPLQKLPDPLDSDSITVLDQPVQLSTISDDNFESPEGVSVDYDTFLQALEVDDLIYLKGEQTGGTVTWQSVSTD